MRSIIGLALVVSIGLRLPSASAQAPSKVDVLVRDEGRLAGTFVGDLKAGFRFVPGDGSPPIPIEGSATIEVGGDGPGPSAGVPPVQVVLGWNQAVSGQVVGLDGETIRLAGGPGGRAVVVDRRGAISLRQRPGEALVLIDGFESIDPSRWTQVGLPSVESSPRLSGEKSLRIGADGSAITASLADPVVRGRIELAFHDTAVLAPGFQWFVDLLFQGEHGPESVRAVLGWSEESQAVQSSGGPTLVVQRLARKPGWHRLEIRFGPDSAEVAVDGNALAHGKGPTGPLVEIRIGSSLVGDKPNNGLAAHVDDLRVVRLATPAGPGEADPGQDEARLLEGDQVFGKIKEADPTRVVMTLLGKTVSIPWAEVAALQFRRDPRPSRSVDGLLVGIEWRSAPGKDPRDLDRAEGALISADAHAFTLETPYAGTLVIPRDRVRRVESEGLGRRIVIDPTAHHLGDEISKILDPPQPEGGRLERKFTLDASSSTARPVALVLDVVEVAGAANGLEYAVIVQKGELRTTVSINGKEFDYLNRHINSRNELPERIRLPIPPGLLKAGENTLKFVQTGTVKDPTYLDDLGVLGIAIETTSRPPVEIKP